MKMLAAHASSWLRSSGEKGRLRVMNTLALVLGMVRDGDLAMPRIIFWILLILWGIGSFGWPENPNVTRGTRIVLCILFAILGYYVFSF